MLPSNVGQPVDNADVAGAPLPVPSDRRVSSSSGTILTAASAATPTAATAASGLAAHGGLVEHPPPLYSNHPDSFAAHLPTQQHPQPQPHPPPQPPPHPQPHQPHLHLHHPYQHHHPHHHPLSAAPLRRRRSSKLSMATGPRRGMSTPNLRDIAGSDHGHMSYGPGGAGSKSRNKLGYHRTSVACGHCRRRKIRCLLAPDDTQGRCANCIRLKKECNFFPVDQQPTHQRPPQSQLKQERAVSGESSSSSSSPPNQQGLARDPMQPFHPYPSDSSAPPSAGFAAPMELRQRNSSATSSLGRPPLPVVSRPSLPHMSTAPPVSAAFDPTRPDRPPTLESSPYLDQSPMSNGQKPVLEDPSASFYRLADSPVPPSVPSFQGPYNLPTMQQHPQHHHHHHQQQQPPPPAQQHQQQQHHHHPQHRDSVGTYTYGVPREDMGWPLQARSMSYGHLESLSLNQSNPYPSPQYYKHVPTQPPPPPPPPVYPPPDGPAHYPVTSTPEPSSAPPPDGRAPSNNFAMHPPWHPSYTGSTIGGMTPKAEGGYNGWFQDSSRLSQVEEEVPTGPLNEEVPGFYQGASQSANS
ncbi:MAG: hypothetical protein M1815_004928 [Lichina confinis]|nr:MAG: hypothetical protein M1815_004928 [Lichina confinis]